MAAYRVREFSGLLLVFLTNNFNLPALAIAHPCQRCWQVELFYKWITQYLQIRTFFDTSENAVKIQVWIAVSVHVHVAIIKNARNPKHRSTQSV
jgi:IS4 transposase